MTNVSKPSSDLSRRALFAAADAGVTLAVAAAARPLLTRSKAKGSFELEFSSPYGTLAIADHSGWAREVGSLFEVRGGPALRVSSVEPFVPFGDAATRSTRSRAFMVHFDVVRGTRMPGDTIHRVSHPRHGSFDLFLTTPAASATKVQAIFS